MILTSWLLLLALAQLGGGSEQRRALLVFPGPDNNHGVLGSSIVNILLEAGYEVFYITPFPVRAKVPELLQIDISSVLNDVKGKGLLSEASTEAPPTQRITGWSGFCLTKLALQHPAVHELLMDDTLTFDVVIAQWLHTGLLAPLAAVFDCPLIWYSASTASWQALALVHEASSPTYSYDVVSQKAPVLPLSFPERMCQTWRQYWGMLWNKYHISSREIPAYKEIYVKPLEGHGIPLPNYESLVYNGSLLLLDAQPLFGQNLAIPLNVKYIGGHHVAANSTTPTNLRKLLNESVNGAIFIDLGNDVNLPEKVKRALVQVVGQLDQTVIWKLDERLWNTPSNLYTVKTISRRHVLSHPGVHLFITSGDLLPLMDAAYHGVPVIAVPTFVDQYANIQALVARGAGILVECRTDLPWMLKGAINDLLSNFSYRSNAIATSRLLRQLPLPPEQELLHWMLLVQDTRGAAHLRSPALQPTSIERYYVDLLVLLLLFAWFFTKVLKLVRLHRSDDKKNM